MKKNLKKNQVIETQSVNSLWIKYSCRNIKIRLPSTKNKDSKQSFGIIHNNQFPLSSQLFQKKKIVKNKVHLALIHNCYSQRNDWSMFLLSLWLVFFEFEHKPENADWMLTQKSPSSKAMNNRKNNNYKKKLLKWHLWFLEKYFFASFEIWDLQHQFLKVNQNTLLTLHGERWWWWHTTANFILLSEAGLHHTRQHRNGSRTNTFLIQILLIFSASNFEFI